MNNQSFYKKIRRSFAGMFTILGLLAGMSACSDYLDIVPDNTLTLDKIFIKRDQAYYALADAYSYLPHEERGAVSTWLLGDEYCGFEGDRDWHRSLRIMRGEQSATSPELCWWSGGKGSQDEFPHPSLYAGIRQCNIFLENIDKVKDMGDVEKNDWKGQVTFLKAYYHFLLLKEYGPIVISDHAVAPDAMGEDLFPRRSKVEDCFNYIIQTIDAAIPMLKDDRAGVNEYGQVDKVVATAIKARVLLFRASPFYTNRDYFGGFIDHFDDEPFFPVNDDDAKKKTKWKEAVAAIDTAINRCLANGMDLYSYNRAPYTYDRKFFEENPEKMQTYYNVRMAIVDPWNRELIWGISNLDQHPFRAGELAQGTNIMLPPGYAGIVNQNGNAHQELSASYAMLERFYTKNGLPVDEDRSFNYNERLSIITTPGVNDSAFAGYQGLIQPEAESLNLYFNREVRFYANMGITGGYWRSHENLITTRFYAGKEGGFQTMYGKNYNLYSGIGIQKWSHPETKAGDWSRSVLYPYPLMRMADLYLMKAEALNEYLDAPTQEVYDAINKVRRRAGIPDVEVAWSSPDAKTPNKHASKEGMRDIILHERSIELAFEGSRYWDMVRHNRAISTFSAPVYGWANREETASTFFVLQTKQVNKISSTSLLFPIPEKELNINSNLRQNPGW
ncbi:MAG: RagB/SusD family nutrient uptake outer membrane protein [Dysgonamonadaceae bacterium]|jgi:hypothetical protein|nr:RagB/SusD family nutrient uptake outer membrane protein [Dysgonamonadaceae bacterium]